jgi:hypothetical protein
MNYRLLAFALALLFLPPLALSLAGMEWDAAQPIAGALWLPALSAAIALLALTLLLDLLTFRRGGHSLWRAQRSYLAWCGVAGILVGMLLGYLNLFAESWATPAANAAALLLAALGGMLLVPAALVARQWLAGLPGLVKLGTRRLALPAMPAEAAAKTLLFAALLGLMLGPIHSRELGWLLWLSPLLLLVALQLLWNESTVFSGLVQGDWSRVLLGSLSGILVCGVALASYRLAGGALYLPAGMLPLFVGFALFGLLSLQIGDIVAEHWRGKPRGEVFKRKPFPISVVTKKDQ